MSGNYEFVSKQVWQPHVVYVKFAHLENTKKYENISTKKKVCHNRQRELTKECYTRQTRLCNNDLVRGAADATRTIS